jgi:hypothetical protein
MKNTREETMAYQGKMMARIDAQLTDMRISRKETMACQGKTEARLEVEDKPASVDTTPEVADDQEVPLEDAEVLSVGEPRKRRRDGRNLAAVRRQKKKTDQHLDARRRRKGQERAQRKNGCRKTTCRAVMARRRILLTKTTRNRLIIAIRKVTRRVQVARRNILSTEDTTRKDLTATGRKETRRANVARHKGNFVGRNRRMEIATGGNHIKDKVERGTQGMWALKRRFWTRRVGGTGSEDSSGGSYAASRNIEKWTLWRGRPPPKRKKVAEQEESGMGSPGHYKS